MVNQFETAQAPFDPDGIDPQKVPFRILSSGARIPCIGMGTFGSDHVSGEKVAEALVGAARVGYRHFDCASVYGNEHFIGRSFQQIMRQGIRREELWITSKLWNDRHGESDVIPSCEKSLKDLQLDYLDLYLVHWPFPNFHPPGCDVTSRNPKARPFIHENFMRTWRQMEKLVEMGKVKHIGTSNMTIPKLKLLLGDARIRPAASEMELHPHFQQPELFQFVVEQGMAPIGYCPMGSPGRPERDRTPEDTVDLEDPVLTGISAQLGIPPAAVCLKWAIQRGQIPIPFSVNRNHCLSNLRAAAMEDLPEADMKALAKIDRNCRLIKGQVFLWKEGQSWEALWDLNGEITPP